MIKTNFVVLIIERINNFKFERANHVSVLKIPLLICGKNKQKGRAWEK